eukprot:gene3964-14045_t
MAPSDAVPDEKEAPVRALDAQDIAFLKTYGQGPYAAHIKKTEADLKDILKRVNDVCGVKESDTGLAPPSRWDLVSDKQMMQEEQPLQVARCTKIINPNTDDAKYVINVKQIAKFVVGLGDKVAPTDIEEGMRVGVDRSKYQIQIPLPPKIDPTVTMMTVEEKPDITYSDIGGSKEQIEKMREFGLPDLESRTQIFQIHTRAMNCERDIRFELLGRLCPNSTGADIRSVCTEAGMYAIRARRKTVTEKDFLEAVNKVIKGYQKFSATPSYMVRKTRGANTQAKAKGRECKYSGQGQGQGVQILRPRPWARGANTQAKAKGRECKYSGQSQGQLVQQGRG